VPDPGPIPEAILARIRAFVASVPRDWPGGAQVTLNISPQGVVTSCEMKGRIEASRVHSRAE
jgi:hypothetical protein